MFSSCEYSIDEDQINGNFPMSSDERSTCNEQWCMALFLRKMNLCKVDRNSSHQIQEISYDVTHNHYSRDKQIDFCTIRQASFTMSCVLSNSHECSHRMTPNSKIIRFQKKKK